MKKNPAAPAQLSVYVVDDDPGLRDSVSLLLGLVGYRTLLFASGEDFLAAARPDWCGCVVTDIRMPGMSGLELQQQVAQAGLGLPFILISAHGQVADARRAFRNRAVDFLEKPFDGKDLVAAIEQAFAQERLRLREVGAPSPDVLAGLTAREKQICAMVVDGVGNREIALRLAISHRTVEVHKGRLMDKLQVRNLAELIALARGESSPSSTP